VLCADTPAKGAGAPDRNDSGVIVVSCEFSGVMRDKPAIVKLSWVSSMLEPFSGEIRAIDPILNRAITHTNHPVEARHRDKPSLQWIVLLLGQREEETKKLCRQELF
jgi:hypothetical protein